MHIKIYNIHNIRKLQIDVHLVVTQYQFQYKKEII